MHTENTIVISGPIDRIFELAADIQNWPRLLPHYRYVVVEEQEGLRKLAQMGASRDGFPVKWRARQELLPSEHRITFLHVGGITKGMDVEWRLEERGGSVHVTIDHKLSYPVPLLGPLFANFIVGRLFVQNIAGKTLQCFKEMVEAEVTAGSSSPESAR